MNTIQNALLSREAEALAEQKIAQAREESAEVRRATLKPLPGPTADIFSPAQEIPVGRWKMRPFYDQDFITLEQLKHPMAEFMNSPAESFGYKPSGPSAWQLFWVFTRPAEEAEVLLARGEDGMAELNRLARAEFGKLRYVALMELYAAFVKQVTICTSAEIDYGPPKQEGEAATADPKS